MGLILCPDAAHSLKLIQHPMRHKTIGDPTCIPDDLYTATAFGNADSVVLHAWAASNVAQDKHLNRHLLLCCIAASWPFIARWQREQEDGHGGGYKDSKTQQGVGDAWEPGEIHFARVCSSCGRRRGANRMTLKLGSA